LYCAVDIKLNPRIGKHGKRETKEKKKERLYAKHFTGSKKYTR